MSTSILLSQSEIHTAPQWAISEWFNHQGLDVESLRGKVIAMHTFQMLCPGCVSHGIPQAQRIQEAFSSEDVAVIGIHTVFEHHEAMTPVSLKAFLHEYRVRFPVGVDRHEGGNPIPVTMQRYGLRGTPSLVLIDREGYVRSKVFGRPDDLRVGAAIASLVAQPSASILTSENLPDTSDGCSADGCSI